MFYIIMTEQAYTTYATILNNKSNCFNVCVYSLKKSFIDIYIIKEAQITDHKSILCATTTLKYF